LKVNPVAVMVLSTRCLFGAIESAELRALTDESRTKNLANPKCKSIGGFRCGLCRFYTCFRCTTRVRKYIEPDDAANDAWCLEIDKCLQLPKLVDSDHILPVGHCCEHKYKVAYHDTDIVDKSASVPSLSKNVFDLPNNEQADGEVVYEPTIIGESCNATNQNQRKRMSKKKHDKFRREDKRRKMKKTRVAKNLRCN